MQTRETGDIRKKKRPRAGAALTAALAALSAIFSAYLLFLCFANAYDPTAMFINATDTGNLLCPMCALTFLCGVIYLVKRYRGPVPRGAARSAALMIIPHAVIVLSLTVEVLTVTNFYNHAMEFLTSGLSCVLLTVYAVLSLLLSTELIGGVRRG